jgi:MscS family membrane protein
MISKEIIMEKIMKRKIFSLRNCRLSLFVFFLIQSVVISNLAAVDSTPESPVVTTQSPKTPSDAKGKDSKAVTEHNTTAKKDLVDHNLEDLSFSTVGKWFRSITSKHFKIELLESWSLFYVFIGVLLTLIIARLLRWFIESHLIKLASKTSTELDDIACLAIGRPLSLFIFSIGFFISTGPLITLMSPILKHIFIRICLALAAGAIAWALYRLTAVIDHLLTTLAASTENNIDDLVVAIVRKALKITIVLVSVLFIGQNILELNITTLLAGAGVMGLAIAFAAQDTIANFFGSIMIILDQPFKVDERVKLGSYNGTIESVGFRSTRIRTLDGNLVTIPNKLVANEAAENIGRRPYIKQTSNFTLVYDTPADRMERAIEILHEILDDHEGQNAEKPPRIYFNAFNDWALNIMVIVWYHPGDYFAFQEWNHKTNLEILRRFNAEGLEFAFPTNTTYLAHDANRKLSIVVDKNEVS